MNLFLSILEALDKSHEWNTRGPISFFETSSVTNCQKVIPESHNESCQLEAITSRSLFLLPIYTERYTKMNF